MNSYTLAAVVASVCLYGACSPVNKFLGIEDNNILEEVGEGWLKVKTGIDLNFSSTPELEIEDEQR